MPPHESLEDNYLRGDIGEFAWLPHLDLVPPWLEVSLHPIYTDQDAVDEGQPFRMFGQRWRERARYDVSLFQIPASTESLQALSS